MIGWGRIYRNGPFSDGLEGIEIPVMNQSSCRDAYSHHLVTNSMMCAGDQKERKSSCHGDSGGPLLVQIPPHNRWHVAGIVSWNELCGLLRKPTVLTRVNHYLDWIHEESPTESTCTFGNISLKQNEIIRTSYLNQRTCHDGKIKITGQFQI